jgi:hypothetical protein
MSSLLPPRPDRRQVLKWMMAASAAALLKEVPVLGQSAVEPVSTPGKGYGKDPDLLKEYRPGDLWPLTFDEGQRATAAALCDAIIPADAGSPGAGALGVHDFIDEWISAPYPNQVRDRPVILKGLAWIEAESARRFGIAFPELVAGQRHALLDDICLEAKAAPRFKEAARFFRRYRDLTAGGFYTTDEGMKDLKYIGNVPLTSFDGPSPELIRQLGLEDVANS